MAKTDQELMREFVGGDAAGFDEILERYRRPVFALILNILRDHTLADDVFQEVFMKVIKGAATYDPERRFAPWLFKIADNACMEALRGPERKHAALAPEDMAEESPAPAHENPERKLMQKEESHALARAVARLPEAQRQVVVLREFAGLPFDEVARIMDSPRNTVLSHMHRALKRLKKMWPEVDNHD